MLLFDTRTLVVAAVWCEAQGQPYNGKVGVAEVIRDRVKLNYNCDGTIPGAIGKRYQFSFFNDDKQDNDLLIRMFKLDWDNPIVMECAKAADEAFIGKSTIVKGALLYHNPKISNPDWKARSIMTIKIADHDFYKPLA